MELFIENYIILDDLKIYTLTAKSFPEDIGEVHHRLYKLFPPNPPRKYFGISRPENGVIIYKAGSELLLNEVIDLKLVESFTVQKGDYISILIKDFRNNLSQIDTAFKQLTSLKNIDPNGYCIEYYYNSEDVRCMIKVV
jgi:hypothetical protein